MATNSRIRSPLYAGTVNRLPRWLLPAVLAVLVLTVLIGSVIR